MSKNKITILVDQQAILIDEEGNVTVAKLKPEQIPDIHRSPELLIEFENPVKKKPVAQISEEHEELFNLFWKSWPKARRTRRPDCRAKFLSICRHGKLKKFQKAVQSYFDYLHYQKTEKDFEQVAKYSSTFMNQWKEWAGKDVGYVVPL